MKLDMGSADMVQDSVGISLFATKNKVKRDGRMTLTPCSSGDTFLQIKNNGNASSRKDESNVEVELINILMRQIRYRTSLEHSLPGTITGLRDPKITKFSPPCQVFVELLGHKASNSEISKVGEEIPQSSRRVIGNMLMRLQEVG